MAHLSFKFIFIRHAMICVKYLYSIVLFRNTAMHPYNIGIYLKLPFPKLYINVVRAYILGYVYPIQSKIK